MGRRKKSKINYCLSLFFFNKNFLLILLQLDIEFVEAFPEIKKESEIEEEGKIKK